MNLRELQRNWDEFGKTDPLYSILLVEDKKGNRWNIDEFFEHGEREIAGVIEDVQSLGIQIPRDSALDFGCGVGRLTQALARRFARVVGVDIAPTMIQLAKKYNRHFANCQFYLNDSDNLKLFPDNSFDFIYSSITLQHMEPRYSQTYLEEFLRLLTPQGLAVFQLPSERIRTSPKPIAKKLRHLLREVLPGPVLNRYRILRYGGRDKLREIPIMEMYGMRREELIRFLEKHGAEIVDVKEDQSDVAPRGWSSFRYYVRSRTSARAGTIGVASPLTKRILSTASKRVLQESSIAESPLHHSLLTQHASEFDGRLGS